MLIEYEGIDILLEQLLYKSDNIGEKIIFDDNGREVAKYKQQIVNGRGKEVLDKNIIIYLAKENVQHTYVSGIQLKTNCKEKIEKSWKVKSRDNKKQKLTS